VTVAFCCTVGRSVVIALVIDEAPLLDAGPVDTGPQDPMIARVRGAFARRIFTPCCVVEPEVTCLAWVAWFLCHREDAWSPGVTSGSFDEGQAGVRSTEHRRISRLSPVPHVNKGQVVCVAARVVSGSRLTANVRGAHRLAAARKGDISHSKSGATVVRCRSIHSRVNDLCDGPGGTTRRRWLLYRHIHNRRGVPLSNSSHSRSARTSAAPSRPARVSHPSANRHPAPASSCQPRNDTSTRSFRRYTKPFVAHGAAAPTRLQSRLGANRRSTRPTSSSTGAESAGRTNENLTGLNTPEPRSRPIW